MSRFIFRILLDKTTTYHRASFNEHFKMPEPALVALFKNATHNLVAIFILGEGAEDLDENLNVRPGSNVTVVQAVFRTLYNATISQEKNLKERHEIQ